MHPTEYSARKLGQIRTEALLKEANEERLARFALRGEEKGNRFLLHFLPRSFQVASRQEQN